MLHLQTAARWLLGGALVFAGASHLSFAREQSAAQVPPRVVDDPPFVDVDVVLVSGVAEIALRAGLVLMREDQRWRGLLAAAFFTATFPGSTSQHPQHRDSLGLDSDRERAIRLLGQPLLVAWALWSTRHRPTRSGGHADQGSRRCPR